MANSKLWRCITCKNGETAQPKIIRGRRDGWVCASTCTRCGQMNFHNKRTDWVRAAHLWRRLGIQLSPEYLQKSWRRISEWKNKRPGCSPALERETESEGNQQTAVATISHTQLLQSTSSTHNPPARVERDHVMGLKKSEAFPKKYLTVADLNGRHISVVIADLMQEEVSEKEKPVLYFQGGTKPLVLNQTNWSMIEEIMGSEDTDDWVGRKIGLYPAKTDFQGKRVPCIRIEAAAPAKNPVRPAREPGEDDVDINMA